MKVSEAMVRCLESEGVPVLFGYPGAAICPFYDALARSDIRHILVRTEQNAGHAAGGYARLSGRCGVCVATSGPGATNLISGVASAYMDSVPLVVITGQVDSHLLGRDVFQEVDTTGMVEPFIKHSYLLKNPADTCRVFKEAFYIARTGRPGPVLIDVPVDVQQMETKFAYPEEISIRSYRPSAYGHAGQVRRAAEAIRHADRPLLVAGGGVFASGARQALEEFLRLARTPAVHTMMGVGALPDGWALDLGMIGVHGDGAANLALSRADLLILAGTRVGDRSIPAPELLARDKKVLHMDIDPAEIGKNIPADIPVVGDLRLILTQLAGELAQGGLVYPDWEREVLHYKEAGKARFPAGDRLDPRQVLEALSARMEPGSVLAADVGQNQILGRGGLSRSRRAVSHLRGHGDHGLRHSRGHGGQNRLPGKAGDRGLRRRVLPDVHDGAGGSAAARRRGEDSGLCQQPAGYGGRVSAGPRRRGDRRLSGRQPGFCQAGGGLRHPGPAAVHGVGNPGGPGRAAFGGGALPSGGGGGPGGAHAAAPSPGLGRRRLR